jgi:hypothetical protein
LLFVRGVAARRALLRCLALSLFAGLALTTYAGDAHAYAWMIKYGYSKCGTCHTDPSGGETLNHMGRLQSQQLLSFAGVEPDQELDTSSQFLWGLIDEPGSLRLGASYRHMLLYTAAEGESAAELRNFPMQADVYGSARFGDLMLGLSLGVARGIEGTAHVRGAQINGETGDGWIFLSRSHFIGLWLEQKTLLRVGRLNLPFGVRVPEHVLWAREATRTDRESDQQHGAALTYTGGSLRADAMVIIGNFQVNGDRFRERGLSVSFEYLLGPTYAVGFSGLLTHAEDDRLTRERNAIRYAQGLNTRLGLSPKLSVLAEADVIKEKGRGFGYVGFVQPDFEPIQGVHLMLTGELLNPGQLQLEDEDAQRAANVTTRFGLWGTIAWYFATHFDLRVDVVARQEAALALQTQLHVYF